MVRLDGDLRVYFNYLAPKVQQDGLVPLTILRDGAPQEVQVPVAPRRPRLFSYLEGTLPSYFVYGPLVFTPVYGEHIDSLPLDPFAAVGNPIGLRPFDRPAFDGEQIVIVSTAPFPHRLMRGYDLPRYSAVAKVNGVPIRNLRHMVETLRDLQDPFVVFEWYDRGVSPIVLDREAVLQATPQILDENSIRSQISADIADAWPSR
jgi:hypothetical protein